MPRVQNLRTSLRKLRRSGLWYVLGRSHFARRAYSRVESLRQRLVERRGVASTQRRRIVPRSESVVEGIDLPACTEALRSDGIYLGLKLPDRLVEELRDYASRTSLTFKGSKPFLKCDVHGGRLPDGSRVSMGMAHMNEKGALLQSEAVAKIVGDPVLLEAVRRHLGYRPNRLADLELFWNFASDLPLEGRLEQGSSVEYHYDIFGYNFVMAVFYLTDAERGSGAHVMMRGSQRGKSFSMLLRGHRTDDTVRRRFGGENELVVEGRAGEGFLEDNSCYHKALPPADADRLMLRIVYA